MYAYTLSLGIPLCKILFKKEQARGNTGPSSPMKLAARTKGTREFDPDTFLATIGDGRKMVTAPKGQVIFTQGDKADAVFYIRQGKVKLTTILHLTQK